MALKLSRGGVHLAAAAIMLADVFFMREQFTAESLIRWSDLIIRLIHWIYEQSVLAQAYLNKMLFEMFKTV